MRFGQRRFIPLMDKSDPPAGGGNETKPKNEPKPKTEEEPAWATKMNATLESLLGKLGDSNGNNKTGAQEIPAPGQHQSNNQQSQNQQSNNNQAPESNGGNQGGGSQPKAKKSLWDFLK